MEALTKVTSANGILLYTDRFTTDRNRIYYTRVLVEVDIYLNPYQIEITIDTLYDIIQQAIEYDWKPKFCMESIKFGHANDECWMKEQQNQQEE